MGREASDTSVSPLQKRSKPSPVPGPSTVIATSSTSRTSCSATRAEIGSTVEEPDTTTSTALPALHASRTVTKAVKNTGLAARHQGAVRPSMRSR
jgi:hypothetical protein